MEMEKNGTAGFLQPIAEFDASQSWIDVSAEDSVTEDASGINELFEISMKHHTVLLQSIGKRDKHDIIQDVHEEFVADCLPGEIEAERQLNDCCYEDNTMKYSPNELSIFSSKGVCGFESRLEVS